MQREPAAHAAEKYQERGGLSEVPSLIHTTMVYSCTCARLQNPEAPMEAPSLVCVPRPGFAAPVRIPQTAAYQYGTI